MSLVIGVDFGTDSVRAVVIDATNGRELGYGVFAYPAGIRESGTVLKIIVNGLRTRHPQDLPGEYADECP